MRNMFAWRARQVKVLHCDISNTRLIMSLQRTIDYLKFDIEDSEWSTIPDLYATNVLQNVKQIGFEIHMESLELLQNWELRPVDYHKTLLLLGERGFKKWNFHENARTTLPARPTPVRTANCMELYYVNTRLV